MEDSKLLTEVLIGLQLDGDANTRKSIEQKIKGIKSLMLGAGVSQEMINDDLAIPTIVIGVNDLFDMKAGETKLSYFFNLSLSQLKARSKGGQSSG